MTIHERDAIDDALADDVPILDDALRVHIAGCADCRAYYDEQRLLLRALTGNVARPTKAEDDAVIARALAAVAAVSVDRAAHTASPAVVRLDTRRPRARALHPSVLGGAVALAAAVAFFLLARREPADLANNREPPRERAIAAHVAHAQGARIEGARAAGGAGGVELVDGAAIREGDVVAVAPDGVLEASLERGGTLRAFPGSRLSLGARGERVDLAGGKVWCLVDAGKGAFVVDTADAVVSVTGTSFFVDDRDGTDVRVVSGTVAVSNARGTVKLAGNEGTHVARDRAPAPARRIDTSSDISEWQKFFEMILKHIQDGMKSLGDRIHFR